MFPNDEAGRPMSVSNQNWGTIFSKMSWVVMGIPTLNAEDAGCCHVIPGPMNMMEVRTYEVHGT